MWKRDRSAPLFHAMLSAFFCWWGRSGKQVKYSLPGWPIDSNTSISVGGGCCGRPCFIAGTGSSQKAGQMPLADGNATRAST